MTPPNTALFGTPLPGAGEHPPTRCARGRPQGRRPQKQLGGSKLEATRAIKWPGATAACAGPGLDFCLQ
jgi:hypothetical protein